MAASNVVQLAQNRFTPCEDTLFYFRGSKMLKSVTFDGQVKVHIQDEFVDSYLQHAMTIVLNPHKYLRMFAPNYVLQRWEAHYISAEICVSRAPIRIEERSLKNLELNVVEVDEEHRRQRHFKMFIDRFSEFCREHKRVLLITEVHSDDLEQYFIRRCRYDPPLITIRILLKQQKFSNRGVFSSEF